MILLDELYAGMVNGWWLFPLYGVLAGLLSGLLGLGGGFVLVPLLLVYFHVYQPDMPWAMHLALGTSMAIVLVSSFAAARAQAKKGNVQFTLVLRWLPWIMLGAFLSGYFSARVPADYLQLFFSVYLVLISYKFLSGGALFQWSSGFPARGLPVMLLGVGLISGLAGIGGGTMLVPLMLWMGLSLHQAVGNSSALGTGLALMGTVGYLLGAQHIDGLPPYAWGSLYLPAILVIGLFSFFAAPWGVRWAHRLPTARLKQIFGGVMLLVATSMIISLVR